MNIMAKIDKISAWLLLICFLLYMLSGFDTLRRILIPNISSFLHLKYLFIPAQLAFTFHSSYAISLALKRWKRWNTLWKSILGIYIILNICLLGYFLVLQF
ncbi:MAG: hypothetical protein WCI30_00965 [Clostridia bacterium]